MSILSLKEQADSLLFGTGIHALLEKYGPVVYTGSYALDLMAWRDIDLYLNLDAYPEPLVPVGELLKELSRRPDLLKLGFSPRYHLKIQDLPQGLCIGLKLGEDFKNFWKLDIWIVDEAVRRKNRDYMNELESRLTPETRELIISIKQKILTPAGRTPSMSGHRIYQAVLFEGLRDEADILRKLGF